MRTVLYVVLFVLVLRVLGLIAKAGSMDYPIYPTDALGYFLVFFGLAVVVVLFLYIFQNRIKQVLYADVNLKKMPGIQIPGVLCSMFYADVSRTRPLIIAIAFAAVTLRLLFPTDSDDIMTTARQTMAILFAAACAYALTYVELHRQRIKIPEPLARLLLWSSPFMLLWIAHMLSLL